MEVSEIKNEGLERAFKVVIPASEIEEKVMGRLTEIAKTVNLPGFRPGKAPISLLKKKYGLSLTGEILEQTVNDSSVKIMTDNALRPVAQPQIEISKFDDGHDLEFTMNLEVAPEIKPIDFKSIKLERLTAEPDEKEIEDSINRLADSNRSVEKINTDRKSKKGDVLVIDFVGSVDGTEFPGGKAEGYQLDLGSGSFIPGFEDKLIGAKAGDDVTVEVAFPKEYGAADLAGKDAVFAVKVHEIREAKPAEINDELAKKLGVDTVEALKEAIRDTYTNEFKRLSRDRLKRSLLDALNDTHDFPVPQQMLGQETDAIWEQFQKHRESDGADEDEDLKGKSDDELKEEFHRIAERRVRLGLLLSDIGRVNNIQVSLEEINNAISAQASQYPGQEQLILYHYQNKPEEREALRGPIFEDKTIDFIIEMATVKDKKVTAEELRKDPDAEPKSDDAKKKGKTSAEPAAKKAKASDKPEAKKAPPKKKAATKKTGDKA
jgi:trigger factor